MEQQTVQTPAQPKVYEEIFKSGLILGLGMFVLGLALLFLMQIAESFWTMVIIFPLIFLIIGPIVLSIFILKNLRKNIGGYWTFKQALKSIFIVFFVGWLVSFGLNLLYTKVIDTTSTERMQEHIKEKKRSDLDKSRLFLGGVIRELLVIGEAANAISPQTKALIPLPWKEVIGMRNQLIHAYFEVNHKIIWMTVTEDIPRLISQLEEFFNSM